ncbi:MAG: threonine--tRNA ligase, partial [Bacilli bacterium]|nr:threonine--tRNA ligase [Bacilli bacterium]
MKIQEHDGSIREIDRSTKEAFDVLNHSTAHLLAQAVQQLYPDAKFGIGPSIDEGFYYDIDFVSPITDEDLKVIEKKMKELASKDYKIERKLLNKEEALETFKNNPYKVELIEGINEDITTFSQGDFIDLCRGPHLLSTNLIRHFKLLSLAGAYWRGDSKNKQLTRIYGTSWYSHEELENYLKLLEERKARDHRILGKQLGIYMYDELVGKGLPMWLPNGFIVRRLLSDYIMDKEIALGYQHVLTPCLGNVELYKTSGHWAHYQKDMFPKMDVDNES